MGVELREIEANGYTFRCRVAGSGGEPVVLLHGFPETSHMWLPLLERLEAEGFRALAPDQRGYSPGARPEGIEHYAYPQLAADVVALADACGFERFHLVGHDHGAGVGWMVAHLYPERLASWTALSVAHVAAFARAIREDPDQQQRSQYIGFFQQPGQAEQALGASDLEALKAAWSESPPEQVAEYLAVFRQPGALTAALNWYRGSLDLEGESAASQVGPIATPTLVIWGNRDGAIGRRSTELAVDFMRGPYRFLELDRGHWLIQEDPERVCSEILAHLRAHPA